jgi:acyl carrier protein
MASLDLELLKLVNRVRMNKGQLALAEIAEGSHLRSDLGFDSLDLAELTVRIEEKLGVDVFNEGVVQHWGEVQKRVARHVAGS